MKLRRLGLVVTLVVILVACEPQTSPDSSTPLQPPALGQVDTLTSGPSTTAVPTTQTIHIYSGALPDGTDYAITLRQDRAEEVTLDYAPIVYEPTGDRVTARMAEVLPGSFDGIGPPTFTDGVFRVVAGSWLVEVVFDGALLETMGNDASEVVLSSIQVDLVNDFPTLVVAPPFAWDPGGIPLEVRYESFVVRSGCGTLAVMCSKRKVVQVIPAQSLYPGSPALFGDVLSVESEAARPAAIINFLDPGPLSARTIPDVVWTGTEMVVWGGRGPDDRYLVDGARFNPETNEWQMLPNLPIDGSQATRAIWVGDRLLVMSRENTSAWDLPSNSWQVVESDGLEPPEYPGFVQVIETNIYLWNRRGIFNLDIAAAQPRWISLPDSPLRASDFRFEHGRFTAMATSGNLVYLAARPEFSCDERLIVAWDEESWRSLPTASLAAVDGPDCSDAIQMAATAEGLVVWYTMDHLTLAYSSESNTWSEIERFPLPGSSEPSGAAAIGAGYFLVPQAGSAAVFRVESEDWLVVEMPGVGDEATMVWTGTEILSWKTAPYGVPFRWVLEGSTLVTGSITD